MSQQNVSIQDLPALKKVHAKQNQQEVRFQTQLESVEEQLEELKKKAREEHEVESLNDLREGAKQETQNRLSKVDSYRTKIEHRGAILDHIQEAMRELDSK